MAERLGAAVGHCRPARWLPLHSIYPPAYRVATEFGDTLFPPFRRTADAIKESLAQSQTHSRCEPRSSCALHTHYVLRPAQAI